MDREGAKKYLAAEMCHTTNDHWGYGERDFNYQSPKSIIESLCACRRVGANYLLNIGPTEQGGIDPMQKELFRILGKWMSIYGEAIYTPKPYPASCAYTKNFVLKGEEYLYFFIHDLGREGDENVVEQGKFLGDITFDNVGEEISSIFWMDNGEELSYSQNDGSLTFNATGYPYGLSTCVRVAKAKISNLSKK